MKENFLLKLNIVLGENILNEMELREWERRKQSSRDDGDDNDDDDDEK